MKMDRRISFEGIDNCRELGGIRCAGGKHIKNGLLLRSANLFGATERDGEVLTETYRLNTVIDLRTDTERQRKPDPALDGVETIFLPIFDEATGGITREYEDMSQFVLPDMAALYRTMMTEEACREAFGQVLTLIFSHDFEKGSILWHCTAGKDRCGLTSALVLGALGASEDVIREDYLLTNETCEREAEMLYRYVLSTGRTEAEAAAAREIFLAKREYLEAALDAIRENYGDLDAFFRDGLHIADGLIKRFRETVLH